MNLGTHMPDGERRKPIDIEVCIDAFCQVWFHLAQLFQRSRLKYEKVNGRTTDTK
jgi:hypothetical protein